ncbi:MAG TPA: dihydrodipicolinate synthase family protein, partial [Candidatus Limnocylindrales bacterium]
VGQLTFAERRSLVKRMLQVVAGRVPVVVGASADDPDDVRAMAEFATGLGATGVLVQAPVRLMNDPAATLDYFKAVCEAPIPMLMIQDLEWGGPGLPIPTIVRLFDEIEPFRCIKVETVPAGSKYTAVLEATGGRLNVSGGWAVPQLIEALDRGIHGVMPGGLHWVLVEVVRRYRNGDRASARELFARLLPILGWQNQHIDISNQFLKLLAVRQGIYAGARLRAPTVVFDRYHRRIADELIDDAIALHHEIGWQPA